jgi:hypothetical protein
MKTRRRRRNPSKTLMLAGAALVGGVVFFFLWQRKQAAAGGLPLFAPATALPTGTPTAAGKIAYGGKLLTPAEVYTARAQVLPAGLTPTQQQSYAVQLIANTGASHF